MYLLFHKKCHIVFLVCVLRQFVIIDERMKNHFYLAFYALHQFLRV